MTDREIIDVLRTLVKESSDLATSVRTRNAVLTDLSRGRRRGSVNVGRLARQEAARRRATAPVHSALRKMGPAKRLWYHIFRSLGIY